MLDHQPPTQAASAPPVIVLTPRQEAFCQAMACNVGAAEAARRVEAATGRPVGLDPERGLDHGAWVPLSLMYPAADVPVAQLSILRDGGPADHLALGEAVRPLRDSGVLVLASGSATHNLYEFRGNAHDAPAPDWVSGFGEWLAEAIRDGRTADLLDYRRQAPFAERNHPTEEHLMPLFAAVGAASSSGNSTSHQASRW